MSKKIHTQYVENNILKRIKKSDTGTAFSARDFTDFGTPVAIRKGLERLTKKGAIRRVRRGFYDLPSSHPLMGETAPDPMALVQGMMKYSNARWQVSGAYAANMLHLSNQVPAKMVILTDGVPKKISMGKLTLEFRRAAPRNLVAAGSKAGMIIQSLRYLKQQDVSDAVVANLRRQLDDDTQRSLQKAMPMLAAWMQPIIQKIIAPEKP